MLCFLCVKGSKFMQIYTDSSTLDLFIMNLSEIHMHMLQTKGVEGHTLTFFMRGRCGYASPFLYLEQTFVLVIISMHARTCTCAPIMNQCPFNRLQR